VDVPEFTAGLLRLMNAGLGPKAKGFDVQDLGGSVQALVHAALSGRAPHSRPYTADEIGGAVAEQIGIWKGGPMARNITPPTLLGQHLGKYVATAGADTTSKPQGGTQADKRAADFAARRQPGAYTNVTPEKD
jgi:hypothetical protein